MPGRNFVVTLCTVLVLASCGERRDIADVAAGLPPFDQLRGMNIAELRGGQVRAIRRNIAPSPRKGYRERIGEWDIVYSSQGFDGSDGSWPQEDVQILEIEATHEDASDSVAVAEWMASITEIRRATDVTPRCLAISGSGVSLRVAEFDRGGDWRVAASITLASIVPALDLPDHNTRTARHTVAVRRSSLTERFPEQGQPNPDSLPMWSTIECPNP